MVTVSEATAIIQNHLYRPEKETVHLDQSIGRILAEAIKADRDLPPFDRVAMDGIAIAFDSFQEGWRDFKVEATLAAGQPRITLKDPHNCIEVMTGTMLPVGCDTVIRYEDVIIVNKIAKLKGSPIEKGQSIHPRAHDAKRGDVLLSPGNKIAASEVALLASVGRRDAIVVAFPKTAIISTGNELVDISDPPQPHQLRRSNSYTLHAALSGMGGHPDIFHLPDDRNVLDRELGKIMTDRQLIILSGGVSKGKFDFVPAALESLGVQMLFHEVSQKPGKPFWFGATKKQVVFALPGNPVSTFMCFYQYIYPWLMKSMGVEPAPSYAFLAEDFSFKPELTYFLEVSVKNESGKLMAYPKPGGGSGNFANLKMVDGFLELPARETLFKAGEVFPYIPFRN